jgi:hypothetical protein
MPGDLKPRISVTFCVALAMFSAVTNGPLALPPCSVMTSFRRFGQRSR